MKEIEWFENDEAEMSLNQTTGREPQGTAQPHRLPFGALCAEAEQAAKPRVLEVLELPCPSRYPSPIATDRAREMRLCSSIV